METRDILKNLREKNKLTQSQFDRVLQNKKKRLTLHLL